MESRRMLLTGAKTPFDEIPISELDLHIRVYNSLLHKRVTTVRAAFHLIESEGDSRRNAVMGSALVEEIRQPLERHGYLSGRPMNYHHLESFSNRLIWLAETQDPEGHWNQNTEYTIGAVLSLIRAGHTSSKGEYATTVDRAVKWLELAFSARQGRIANAPLRNSTMAYSLLCVLAENYEMPRPIAQFDCPSDTDFKTVLEARRWALLVGNAPVYGWQDDGWNMFYYDEEERYTSNHKIEFAWMTVGAPRSITAS